MAQTIQILRTTTNTPPATLLPGAFSVELGTFTKLWIGSAGGNRLLLSSNPADSAMAGAAYLKLLGGTLTGPLALAADPTASLQAATKQYVDVAAGAAPHNVGRNLIHNPLFNIAQRGAGTFTSFGSYTADRWVMDGSLDTVSFSLGAFSDTARSQIGDEAATQFLENDFTGNAGAAAQSYVQQKIEGVRRLAGKTVTVSFWAVSSGTLKLGVNIVQIFGTGGSPSPFVQVLGTGNSFTTSGTWARFTTTIAIPSIAGKTLGTNGDDYTILRFYYSSGATNNATAGNIGVQSGTTNIWGVQLEIGSVATPLEKPDPQQDLAKCQRFYQTGHSSFYGYQAGGSGIGAQISFPVTMRAAPTIAFLNSSYINASGIISPAIYLGSFRPTAATTALGGSAFESDYTASADL